MSRIYIFHNDQVIEYDIWPDREGAPIGMYSFEPDRNDAHCWGRMLQNTRVGFVEGTRDFQFIDEADVPSTVPKLYRAMALLLT